MPLLAAAAFLPSAVRAADVYLDTNGVTAGSGNTDTTWSDVAAIWGNADGTAETLAWTAGDVAILAAGTDYTGTRTLTVAGTHVIGGLKLSSANTGLGTLSVTGGTLDFGSSLGSLDFSAWGATTGKTLNLASTLTGSGGLEIRAFGDLTATGGGNNARFNLNGTNTFTGNVTLKAGLVAYSSNAAFGNAANRLLLDGGGLLDPNLNITLARDIEVLAGGGTLRAYGTTTMTHTGALIGAAGAVINRTDGGTVVHSGDLSGWLGTYNIQRGVTRLSSAQTIGGNWVLGTAVNGSIAAGSGDIYFGGSGAQRFEGAITQANPSTMRVEGSSDLTFAGTIVASTLSMNGQGSVLRVVDGANLSFNYLNIGDGDGTSGHIYQTGGTLTIRSGGSAMRLGHWNNNGNRASLLDVSGGTFDASAAGTLNVGWDGDSDIIVGGGPGPALFKASSIQLDANTSSGSYDNTLTILANGTVEVSGTINAASAADRANLSGGTLRLTAAADTTWGAPVTAVADTTSTLDVGGLNLTLSSGTHAGTGTVNLSSATGSLIFSQGGNHTVSWNLAGTTAISKTGAGTLTFTGASSHSGTFTVSAGRLDLAAGSDLSSALTIASGGALGGKGSAANVTLASGGFLNANPLVAGTITFGNLTLNGGSVRLDGYLAAGVTLPVLGYTGTLTGAFGTHLSLEGSANYRSATFTDTAGAVTLDLGTRNLTWSGIGGGQWNVLSAARWNSDADTFAWGDHVTFSGASANPTVTLAGELRPGSVTVSGDTNYSLVGSAGNFLAGPMALAKSGDSTLTVSGPNTFSGGTTLSRGAIVVGGSVNNALGTGAITLGDASTGANPISLLLANGRTINNTLTISSQATGPVTLGFSGTGGSYTAFEGGVILQRDLTISPAGNTDRLNFGGVISGTGNVTIQGGSRVTFSNSNTWSGNLTITGAGTIYQTFNSNSLPDTANVTVDAGATFRIYTSETIAGLNGAGTLRPIAGKPTLTVGGNNASGNFSGSWVNDGTDHVAVTKIGTGTQVLSGAILSPGDVTVNDGILAISGTGEIGRTLNPGSAYPILGLRGTATLRIDAGASFAIRRNSDFTGTVNVAGGTLTLGHGNAINTGSVTLSGGTLAFDNRGSTFTAINSGATPTLTGGTLATHTTTANYGTLHNTTGDVVPGNTTHVYAGRIYLTAGAWSFAKRFDDAGSVLIGGATVLSNSTWNATGTGTFNAAADGWYDIEVRAYQGGGGVGPNGSDPNAVVWNKGFGIKKGAATNLNNDYATFDLAGVAGLGGALTYAADLTFDRNITVSAASTLDTSAMVGTPGSTAVDGNGAGGDLTLSGVLSGAGNLTKTGAGTVTLSGANTHTGRLIINGGRVVLPTNSTYRTYAGSQIDIGAATLAVNVGSGTRYDFGAVTYNFTSSGGGAISIGSGVNWVAQGNWTFATNGGARSTISGAGMNLNGSGRSAIFNVARGTDAASDLDVTLAIGNTAGGITKNGDGILSLGAANTFTGAVTLNAGSIRLTNTSAISSASGLTLGGTGGTLVLDRDTPGAAQTFSAAAITFGDTRTLSVTKGANVTSGTATLNLTGFPNFGASGKTATFDVGADVLVNISGSLNGTQAFARLAKSGAGTLALSGNNDWWDPASSSGLVTVSGGTLELRSANALGDGATGANSIALSLAAGTTVRYASNTALANHSDVTTTGTGATLILDRASSGVGLTQTLDVLTLAAGTFSVSGGSNIASGTAEARFSTASLAGNATLGVSNPAAGSTLVTFTGAVSGSANLTKSGNGTLTLSGANTLAGALRAEGGTLNLTNTNRSVTSVTATSGATVNLGATNMFVGGHGTALADSMVLSATDGGTLVFNSSMDARIGNITLSGGTLTSNRGLSGWDVLLGNVVSGAATVNVTGTAASVMNGTGGIHLQGVQNFAVADVTSSAAADLTVSLRLDNPGNAGGSAGGISKSGAGTMTLSGANTFAGPVGVRGGVLEFSTLADGAASNLGSGSGSSGYLALVNGTLRYTGAGAVSSSRFLWIDQGTGAIDVSEASGTLTLTPGGGNINRAFTKSGAGTLDLGGSALITGAASVTVSGGRLTLRGGNSYSGATTVSAGATLEVAGSGTLGGGTYDTAIANAGTLLLSTSSNQTLGGAITGAGSLSKSGAGTLTLSGTNTFSGGLAISGGQVAVASLGSLGAGAVTLGASGTLRLALTLAEATTLSSAFTHGFSGSGILDLALSGESALSLGTYANFGGSVRLTSGVFDNAGFSGELIFAGGRLLDATTFSGTTTVSGVITDVSQLPTSGTLVLDQGGSIDFGDTEFEGTIKFRGGSVQGNGFKGTLEVDAPNVTVSGNFGQGRLKVGAGKSVTLDAATTGTLVFDGGAIVGGANLAGRVELAPGKTLVLGQDIDTLGASATLAVGSGSSVDLNGAATAATIAFSGGSLAGAQSFTGTLQVLDGATLSTDGTVGGTVTLASGTTLSGNGTFTGTVNVASGTLSPGSSPGLTTYGELNLTGGSTLQLEFFAAEEEVLEGVETVRGYDTLVATTLNFGTAGDEGTILLRLATLTNWSDSADWVGGLGLAPAEGSSLILGPGDMQRDFTLARFDESDRSLTLSDGLNVTSWFTVDSALYVGTGATSYQLFINSGDSTNWELNLRVVPEPSTYGLAFGLLALAGVAVRRRKRKG